MSYVTLAEFKAYVGGFTTVDADRDTNLQAAIDTASARIDRLCGRTFALAPTVTTIAYRTRGRTFTTGIEYGLIVPDIATTVGLIVPNNATYDTTVLPITTLWSSGQWPAPTVEITARFGWPEVPDEIVQATKILAARLWRRAVSPEGVVGSEQWGVVRLSRTDPDVQALIDPYVLPGFA
jgi:hypothetical protein